MARQQRDSQRMRVYRAQEAVAKGMHYPTIAECQGFADSVTGSRWWRDRDPYRGQKIAVADGRARKNAVSYNHYFRIALPRHTRYQRVILHELAHQLTDHRYGLDAAWHGPEFAGVFLAMVYRFIGPENGQALRRKFRELGVRHIPTRGV